MKHRVLKISLIVLIATIAIVVGLDYRSQPFLSKIRFASHPAFAAWQDGSFKSVADIAEKVLPGVVNISSTRRVAQAQIHPFFREFFGFQNPSPRSEQSLGSGVIVSSDGIVITNNHVVANATDIRVTLSDEREFEAKIVGTDPKSDLAVLRLKNARNLKPLSLGDSRKMRLGDPVLAIGNPFGVGQTVTMGIVSAKGRANMGIVDYEDFIQTDAAINPGNSGGALVNMSGELIGINTAILSRSGGSMGIGFAIPSNMAQPIMNSLIKSGKVVRGWLGVSIQEVNSDLARAMHLPTTRGVLIADVDERGPAHKAGLRRGDFILKINEQPVTSPATLRNIIASAGTGAKVSVEYVRQGSTVKTSAVLESQPDSLERGAPDGDSSDGEAPLLGLSLEKITPKLRRALELPQQIRDGIVVVDVAQGSPAAYMGLAKGDVILEANRVKMDSVSRFKKVFAEAADRVLLLVYRDGSTMYLLLQKEPQ